MSSMSPGKRGLARSALRMAALILATGHLLVACSSVSYNREPVVFNSRYTTVENYSTEVITPQQVDDLLSEVAEILGVRLDPTRPTARIIVTSPWRIAELYGATVVKAPHGADANGLYFPGASLVLISSFDRTILGHELAHYLTDHYLKHIPADSWEAVASMVERKLPTTPASVPAVPTVLAAHAALSPRFSE